jgi:hypothetical protein
MKRTLVSIITTGIMTFLMYSNANAQIAMNKSVKTDDRLRTEKYNLLDTKTSSGTTINFRTLKDFKKRFASVNNATWDITSDGYFAEFSADSIKTIAAYGKKGKWFYTIQRYNEKKLPADIRARVKSVYYDYSILNINEVHVPDYEDAIYILDLKFDQHFKTVRVSGEEMEVIADFHS